MHDASEDQYRTTVTYTARATHGVVTLNLFSIFSRGFDGKCGSEDAETGLDRCFRILLVRRCYFQFIFNFQLGNLTMSVVFRMFREGLIGGLSNLQSGGALMLKFNCSRDVGWKFDLAIQN